MLGALQSYIAVRGTVSLADLAQHFRMDPLALRPMLDRLTRKGRIRRLPCPDRCSGCQCCAESQLEYYEWVAVPVP